MTVIEDVRRYLSTVLTMYVRMCFLIQERSTSNRIGGLVVNESRTADFEKADSLRQSIVESWR